VASQAASKSVRHLLLRRLSAMRPSVCSLNTVTRLSASSSYLNGGSALLSGPASKTLSASSVSSLSSRAMLAPCEALALAFDVPDGLLQIGVWGARRLECVAR